MSYINIIVLPTHAICKTYIRYMYIPGSYLLYPTCMFFVLCINGIDNYSVPFYIAACISCTIWSEANGYGVFWTRESRYEGDWEQDLKHGKGEEA